jgi:hypothetical protein
MNVDISRLAGEIGEHIDDLESFWRKGDYCPYGLSFENRSEFDIPPIGNDDCGDYPQPSRVSHGSSFTSATPLSPLPPSRCGFQSSKPASRSGSVSSLRSNRGRNRISKIFKKTSNRSMYSSGMGEHVFDSNQVRSSSRASSGRSGRTVPLNKLARAGMKAVRAIRGAS